jgi:hypothetical protein
MPDISDNTNWFETDASNNKSPPAGWPEGQMPSTVNDCARANMGALKRFWDRVNPVQVVTPASGLWTFTTGNAAYPTAYMDGEIYTFRAGAVSATGDNFQVNALGAKPIYRSVHGNVVTIGVEDIAGNAAPVLIYNELLNSGAGGFILTNPFVPIVGDGAGGASVGGNLSVGSNLTVAGTGTFQQSITIGGLTLQNSAGVLFTPSPFTSGSNVTVDGNLTVSGQATFQQSITIGGLMLQNNAGALYTPGALSSGSTITGAAATITGGAAVGSLSIPGLGAITNNTNTWYSTSSGFLTGYAVQANNSGTAFYAPNGNVVCVSLTQSSDARLKTDIADSDIGLAAILGLAPKTFRRIAAPDREELGLIAQDVATTLPQAVATIEMGDEPHLGIDFAPITAALINAVKQLAERVIALEAK